MTESGLYEQQNQEQNSYVFPDDIITIMNLESLDDRIENINVILQATKQGTLQLHPELATATFFVMCYDPEITSQVLEEKNINWQTAGQLLLEQRDQIVSEIEQIHQQIPTEQQTPYHQQLIAAEPYIRQAFSS